MKRQTNSRGWIWRSMIASSIAASLLLGIVVADGAHAQSRGAKATTPSQALLERYTRDITSAAAQGKYDSFTEDQVQVDRAIEILARGSENNPVILTDSQAVRNVVIAGVARRIAHGDVPEQLLGRRVLKLDLDALFRDFKTSDELKAKVADLFTEAANSSDKVILFVDPIQSLVGATAAFDGSVSHIVRDAIAGGTVQCVGTSTRETFDESIGSDESLAALFTKVDVATAENSAEQEDAAADNSSNDEEFTGEKISDDLSELIANPNAPAKVKLILQVTDPNSASLRAELTKLGATVSDTIPRLGALAIEIPTSAVTKLTGNSSTHYVSLDRPVKALGHVETTTGEAAMLAEPKNVGLDGSGVGVAVLDSGISTKQKSLSGRIVYSRDFTGENTTEDLYGHGTFVASMIAAKNGPYGGKDSGANLINFRVLNSQGVGSTSALLNALYTVLLYRGFFNIRVVNLSLGGNAVDSYKNDPICRAVRRLVNAGVVVVTAAGNDGKDATHDKLYGRIHSPGNEPAAITVGAANTFGTDVRSADIVTTFSSRGPTRSFWKDAAGLKHYDNLLKPDLVAPGNKIIGAAAANNKLESDNPDLCVSQCGNASNSGKGDMRLSGTSVASPIVAGAVAVLLEANPNLTPNMVKVILMYTAQSLKGYNMLEQGAGELNLEGGVRLAKAIRTDLSPLTAVGSPLLVTSAPTPSTSIAGQTLQWSQGVLFNYDWASGSALITKYQAVYAQGVLLGDGVLVSDGVLL